MSILIITGVVWVISGIGYLLCCLLGGNNYED